MALSPLLGTASVRQFIDQRLDEDQVNGILLKRFTGMIIKLLQVVVMNHNVLMNQLMSMSIHNRDDEFDYERMRDDAEEKIEDDVIIAEDMDTNEYLQTINTEFSEPFEAVLGLNSLMISILCKKGHVDLAYEYLLTLSELGLPGIIRASSIGNVISGFAFHQEHEKAESLYNDLLMLQSHHDSHPLYFVTNKSGIDLTIKDAYHTLCDGYIRNEEIQKLAHFVDRSSSQRSSSN